MGPGAEPVGAGPIAQLDGLIGSALLDSHIVMIDYRRNMLFLRASKKRR
jgi:hypothetical protein